MDFSQAITSAFVRWSGFSGRSSRSEYWWFYLLVAVVFYIVISYYELSPVLAEDEGERGYFFWLDLSEMIVNIAIGIVVFIASLAVGARRLHDIGKSGWWQLLHLVPIVGPLLVLYWAFTPGDSAKNKYGVNPLAEDEPSEEDASLGEYLQGEKNLSRQQMES